ncbi:tetratricopeptide repeat protein [Aeromicrobium sp. Root495]|uniref:tetratricopeptide repeat protein n=1 Tax=Aeromicrobium sp. Root495 TaxID=1736550 RepID=UPI00138F02DF
MCVHFEVSSGIATPSNLAHAVSAAVLQFLAEQDQVDLKQMGVAIATGVGSRVGAIAVAALLDGVKAVAPALSNVVTELIESAASDVNWTEIDGEATALRNISEEDTTAALTALIGSIASQYSQGIIVVDQVERASEGLSSSLIAVARHVPDTWRLVLALNDEMPAGSAWLRNFWPDLAYERATSVPVEPLRAPAVQAWYTSVRGSAPAPADVENAITWTQGRPLLLEEWITGRTDLAGLKSTLTRVGPYYKTRIDALPSAARALLRRLALFPVGTRFGFDLVRALSGEDDPESAYEVVNELVGELFLVTDLSPQTNDTQYLFRHDTIHLHTLTGAPAQVVRDLATKTHEILKTCPLPQPELNSWSMARLAVAAGESDDGPRIAAEACRALMAARSFVDAEHLARSAIEAFPHAELDELRLAHADAQNGMGDYEAALASLEMIGQPTADVWLSKGRALLRLNRYGPSQEALQKAWASFPAKSVGTSAAQRELITIKRDLGNYVDAVHSSRVLLSGLSDESSDAERAGVLRALARSLALAGDNEAVIYANSALELGRQLGIGPESTGLLTLGEALRHSGDPASALEAYRESADLSLSTGNRDCYLWAVLGASDSLRLLGRPEDSRREAEPATTLLKSSATTHPLESLHFDLLEAATALGERTGSFDHDQLASAYADLEISWPSELLQMSATDIRQTPLPF